VISTQHYWTSNCQAVNDVSVCELSVSAYVAINTDSTGLKFQQPADVYGRKRW